MNFRLVVVAVGEGFGISGGLRMLGLSISNGLCLGFNFSSFGPIDGSNLRPWLCEVWELGFSSKWDAPETFNFSLKCDQTHLPNFP